MKMNRRNVLIGVGAIVGGGGAALGTGAFSSTEAERGLEVTVIADEDIAGEIVDVHIDPTAHDDVSIDGDQGDEPDNYFPTDTVTFNHQDLDSADSNAVSLIQSDVTIQFGPYLSGSENTYDGFFRIINDEPEDDEDHEFAENYDVTFSTADTGENDFSFGDDNEGEYTETSVERGQDRNVDLTLQAEETETESGQLIIEITADE